MELSLLLEPSSALNPSDLESITKLILGASGGLMPRNVIAMDPTSISFKRM